MLKNEPKPRNPFPTEEDNREKALEIAQLLFRGPKKSDILIFSDRHRSAIMWGEDLRYFAYCRDKKLWSLTPEGRSFACGASSASK